jgi:signal transduction histidine kinase
MILRSASMTRGALDEDVAHGPVIVHRLDNGPTGPAITYGLIRKSPSGRDIHFVIATDQRLLDETIARFTRELTLWLLALAVALVATGVFIVVFGFRPLDRLAQATSRLRAGTTARLDDTTRWRSRRWWTTSTPISPTTPRSSTARGCRPATWPTRCARRWRSSPTRPNGWRRMAAPPPRRGMLEQTRLMAQQIEYQLARPLRRRIGRTRRDQPPVRRAGADPLRHAPAAPGQALRSRQPRRTGGVAGRSGGPVRTAFQPHRQRGQVVRKPGATGDWRGRQRPRDRRWPRPCRRRHRPRFEIGSRFDPGKPGSGLGLAIAHDIATAYGLSLTLENRPSPAHGLIVQLRARGPTDP